MKHVSNVELLRTSLMVMYSAEDIMLLDGIYHLMVIVIVNAGDVITSTVTITMNIINGIKMNLD